jgi:hypothetical protein
MGLIQALLTSLSLFIITTRSQILGEPECGAVEYHDIPVVPHCEDLVHETQDHYQDITTDWPIHFSNEGCEISIFPINLSPAQALELIHEDEVIEWNQSERPIRGNRIRWNNIQALTQHALSICFPPQSSNTNARIYTVGYYKARNRPAVVEVEIKGLYRENYSGSETTEGGHSKSSSGQSQEPIGHQAGHH